MKIFITGAQVNYKNKTKKKKNTVAVIPFQI